MRSKTLKTMMLVCALGAGGMGLTACVTPIPEHVPLSIAAREAMTSTEVVAPVKQSEIYIYVAPINTGGQGGMIGALIAAGIDASNASAAEEAVKPARNAIIDFNFDETLRQDLTTSLSEVGFLKTSGVRIVRDISAINMNKAISESPQDAVLMTVADYQFNSDASAVTVSLQVHLYSSSPTMDAFKPAKGDTKFLYAPNNALYRNKFAYVVDMPGPRGKREDNVLAWTTDNGAPLRKALIEGSAEVTRQLAKDLPLDPPPAPVKKK